MREICWHKIKARTFLFGMTKNRETERERERKKDKNCNIKRRTCESYGFHVGAYVLMSIAPKKNTSMNFECKELFGIQYKGDNEYSIALTLLLLTVLIWFYEHVLWKCALEQNALFRSPTPWAHTHTHIHSLYSQSLCICITTLQYYN